MTIKFEILSSDEYHKVIKVEIKEIKRLLEERMEESDSRARNPYFHKKRQEEYRARLYLQGRVWDFLDEVEKESIFQSGR